MKRIGAFVLTSIVSLVVGCLAGAFVVGSISGHFMNHSYVTSLMERAYAAREIYSGRSGHLADHLRGQLPEQVLGVEREFRQDETRNTAFRLVGEVYAASNVEVPIEIRAILASVPPRPSRKVPDAVK